MKTSILIISSLLLSNIAFSKGSTTDNNEETQQQPKTFEYTISQKPIVANSQATNLNEFDFYAGPQGENRWIGASIGYTTKQICYIFNVPGEFVATGEEIDGRERIGLTNMVLLSEINNFSEDEDSKFSRSPKKLSNGLSIGLFLAPEIAYGIGIQTGIYYDLMMENAESEDYEISVKDHSLSIPLRLQYRYELFEDFSLFAYTGPSFDIGMGLTAELKNVHSGQKTDINYYKNWDIRRLNVLWGAGIGFRYKGLQFRIGGDWGLKNMAYEGDKKNKMLIHKPLQLAISYQF